MGYIYDEDQGVPQDYFEAFRWYKKASEKENEAVYN
jgi:TPR repeat protein